MENDIVYKIMLVEDDDVDAMDIERNLNSIMRNDIIRYRTVKEAIQNISNEFDCFILDYLLPDGTGLEILETIRSSDKISPIVMFTGKGNESVAVTAMKAGLTDYIVKSEMLKSMNTVADLVKQGVEVDEVVNEIQAKLDRLKKPE